MQMNIRDRFSAATERICRFHRELTVNAVTFTDCGTRPDGSQFCPELFRVKQGYDFFEFGISAPHDVYLTENDNSLATGNPLYGAMYPPAREMIRQMCETPELSKYPLRNGDPESKDIILDYLRSIGFCGELHEENIGFAFSTTHAFAALMKLIVQPGDVVLFTAPTYGIFAFVPEREGGVTKFLQLCEEDDWQISPAALRERIREINAELLNSPCRTADHTPCVVAFFQSNPCNPTGRIMGRQDIGRMQEILDVCREAGVLYIDDLIYRDLGYDRENPAVPMASLDGDHSNVVSLLGISKSYGAAGLRAGIIAANEIIIAGVRNYIAWDTDSTSYLNMKVLSAVYNAGAENQRAYQAYFSEIMAGYRDRLNIVRCLIDGLDSLPESERERTRAVIAEGRSDAETAELLRGTRGVQILSGCVPEAGFFALLDFRALAGKSCDGITVTDDLSLIRYLYHRYRLKLLPGCAMGMQDPQHIVARASFSMEIPELTERLILLKEEAVRLYDCE